MLQNEAKNKKAEDNSFNDLIGYFEAIRIFNGFIERMNSGNRTLFLPIVSVCRFGFFFLISPKRDAVKYFDKTELDIITNLGCLHL